MSTPISISATVIVERPIMEVFDYIANPDSVAHWVPLFSSTTRPESHEGYATRFEATVSLQPLPWGPTVEVEVTDLVPGRRIAYRCPALGQTSAIEFQSSSRGTIVTTTHSLWSWYAVMSGYWSRLFEPLGADYMRHAMLSMKRHLEGRQVETRPLVFFSYRRSQAQYVGGRIFDALTQEFGTGAVFRDVDSLLGGGNWRVGIRQGLLHCKAVVAHIEDQWEDEIDRRLRAGEEDMLREELELALQSGGKIIPVFTSSSSGFSMADRQRRLRDKLPPGRLGEELRNLQGLFVRSDPDFRNDVERILRAVWDVIRGPLERSSPEGGTTPTAAPAAT
jgi:uncharacterized protein YndB with AHSA1/START domain